LCLFNISLENPGFHCHQKTHSPMLLAAFATRSLILSSYKVTKHYHSGGTKKNSDSGLTDGSLLEVEDIQVSEFVPARFMQSHPAIS